MNFRYFLATVISLAFCLAACHNSQHKAGGSTNKTNTEDSAKSRRLPVTEIQLEREFTQINNISNIDVVWHEGPCHVQFEGNPMLLGMIEVEVDDAGVTFVCTDDLEKGMTARFVVTSPTLRIVSNNGNGTLHLQGVLHTTSLEIGNMYSGVIKADSIDCQSFKYSSGNQANCRFDYVHATDALIIADGGGNSEFQLDVTNLNLQSWGTSNITLDGHADHQNIACSNTIMLNNRLQ